MLIKLWNNYKWEIMLIGSILIILICWIVKPKSEDTGEYKIDLSEPVVINVLPPKKNGKRVNKYENMCRNIMERIYQRPFPSIRPDFLKNPKTGKNLELDMFNEDLMLAVETNGSQHYHYNPYYHRDYNDFLEQVQRDQYKRDKCNELGITLIEVPYTVRKENFENYLLTELKRVGKL